MNSNVYSCILFVVDSSVRECMFGRNLVRLSDSCFILQPASLYKAALTIFFGAENVDEALKIYPQPSDGEDIRPQISVSLIPVDLNLGGRGRGGLESMHVLIVI